MHKYEIGEKFLEHFDWFNPESDPSYLTGQRIWTSMVYLNDDFEGGNTRFINLDINIKPKKGTAIIWANIDENGMENEECKSIG